MKSFKNYITEAGSENEKLVQKLEKTRASIHSHWRRGGEARHQKGRELIYRYNDIANKLKDTEEGMKQWNDYCKKHNFDRGHEGHDHYS